ncbi:TIGR00266 family protein [Neorhodopirellula pilleata]|uniref:TIGR00266 family protein n=1 Tax=Neorhodopirellula pilleata TaxID=2714738 RepID=A0A5C6ARN0_9BACT|nr:TIGR00266 family protein [Neorhodopirellula pilleata]TWU01612.1 hypothetical protein Pla100_13470 [Neorhodopirellula pilleata]
MIQITCPNCSKGYRLADTFAGKKVKCKDCGQLLKIKDLPPGTIATANHVSPPNAIKPESQVPAPTPRVNPDPVPSAPARPASAAVAAPMAFANPIEDAWATGDIVEAELVGEPVAFSGATGIPPTGLPGRPVAKPQSKPTSATQNLSGRTPNLEFEITQRPDFAIAKIHIPAGQKIFAEPSAMVSMSPNVHLEAGFKGGLGKTLGRFLGGESLIINTFTALDGPGEIMFAGGAAGDVAYHRLNGNTMYLQRGAYMFNSDGVEVTGSWQGAKGFFSGEGLVLLKASGVGDLFFSSYGAIMPIDVTDGFMVDTGYIVAFEETLQYRVTVLPGLRAGGKIKSFFFGGEGLVCQFAGQGRVWVQTRQAKSFLQWVNPYRPVKNKN